ncbi:chymotrypsin-1 isoform X2 [Drosophila mojavensis]|uniref:Uncharacterized protein, isoform B n=1 Tax=Drosophila mojavensis TaxID=7230 RepID=A0A0Q9XIL3_DROMO|nr:chymotrypsin-1 isoform X2 [Drosophila mojavensis]KRG03608.1 uncharacterized protein Dmoj_GI25477, isoform B [Drosophila mojavensis]
MRIFIDKRRDVDVKEFPYLGTLRKLKEESQVVGSGYVCGATLIHNRVFVTSGECIHGKKPEDMIVVIGTTLMKGLPKTILVLKIEYMRLHGLYVYKKHNYNIGLIFTSEDTPPIKDAIGYIPINKKRVPPHTKCYIIGWGVAAKKLRSRPKLIINWSAGALTCYKTTRNIGLLCTYRYKRSKPDHSDAGTPLICNNKLAGVFITRGSNKFHIFTDIYSFRKWINGAIYLHFKSDKPLMIETSSIEGSICSPWLVVLVVSIYFVT